MELFYLSGLVLSGFFLFFFRLHFSSPVSLLHPLSLRKGWYKVSGGLIWVMLLCWYFPCKLTPQFTVDYFFLHPYLHACHYQHHGLPCHISVDSSTNFHGLHGSTCLCILGWLSLQMWSPGKTQLSFLQASYWAYFIYAFIRRWSNRWWNGC